MLLSSGIDVTANKVASQLGSCGASSGALVDGSFPIPQLGRPPSETYVAGCADDSTQPQNAPELLECPASDGLWDSTSETERFAVFCSAVCMESIGSVPLMLWR